MYTFSSSADGQEWPTALYVDTTVGGITSSFDTDPIGDTSANTYPSSSGCTSSPATVAFSHIIGTISRHLHPPSLESHLLSAPSPGDLLGGYAHVREIHCVRWRVSTFYPSCSYHQTNLGPKPPRFSAYVQHFKDFFPFGPGVQVEYVPGNVDVG